jgi:hypothetical protein
MAPNPADTIFRFTASKFFILLVAALAVTVGTTKRNSGPTRYVQAPLFHLPSYAVGQENGTLTSSFYRSTEATRASGFLHPYQSTR